MTASSNEHSMALGLAGKVAVITGGSDGLGLATATRLASAGCRIALCARRDDYLQQRAGEIREATGGEVFAMAADVTRSEDIDAFCSAVTAHYGGMDILVNNAGASAAAGFDQVDDAAWQSDIDLKIMAQVRFSRHAVASMRERGGGAIINAAIIGGKTPPAQKLPTTVTRAAGLNLTKALANEYAPERIRVNAVCIGLIKSAQWQRRANSEAALSELYAEMAQDIPLGRVGEAHEYADLVAFLVSRSRPHLSQEWRSILMVAPHRPCNAIPGGWDG